MSYTEERKRQLQHEIDWIKNKLLSVKKPRHRNDLERQIKEREYELHLGIFEKQKPLIETIIGKWPGDEDDETFNEIIKNI